MFLKTLVCLFLLAISIANVVAQTNNTTGFAKVLGYSQRIERLNEEIERQEDLRVKLTMERKEALSRLSTAREEFAEIRITGAMRSLKLAETQLSQVQLAHSFEVQNFLIENTLPRPPSFRSRSALERARASTLQTLAVTSLNLNEQVKQLDLAGRLTVDRLLKVISQLRDLSQRIRQWTEKEEEIYQRTLDLADYDQTLCRIQWKAALRELSRDRSTSPPMEFVKAATLLRLDETDKAEKILNELTSKPSRLYGLAYAMRGEIAARSGDEKEVRKTYAKLAKHSAAEPRISWVQARAYMILGQPLEAIKHWERLLKSGKHDIAAHRGLALAHVAASMLRPNVTKYKTSGLENAKVASSLSAEQDWSSQIALALATAVIGDLDKAVTIADSAASLAILERQTECIAIADALREGTIPTWKY